MEIIRWISLMSIVSVTSSAAIVAGYHLVPRPLPWDRHGHRRHPDHEVRAIEEKSGEIIAHFIDGGRIAHQLDIEVMIVGIRAAGMVDLLLNISGRNVSDFEQAIGRGVVRQVSDV